MKDTLLPTEARAAAIPDHVQVYLAHVVGGRSIRSLARHSGCHASTVLRQVRRCESRRDDLLVDRALTRLGRIHGASLAGRSFEGTSEMTGISTGETERGAEEFEREAGLILRRLGEPGACLAVAEGMDTAIVVREGDDGNTVRTGTAPAEVAEALALRDWIACKAAGRVRRYRITAAGRTALKAQLAASESAIVRGGALEDARAKRTRYIAESPLLMLSRRRDKDGSKFLTQNLVRAGERLREDYEMAAMSGAPEGGWESLMMTPPSGDPAARGGDGALARLHMALADLGPGLGDIVLRVCCQLEGLEVVETRMGWAARSGKIVLRIGLQRLERHYEMFGQKGGGLIG